MGSNPTLSAKREAPATRRGLLFWNTWRGFERERCKKACRGNCGAAPPGADEAAPQFPQPRRFASLSLYGEVRKRHCGKAVVRAALPGAEKGGTPFPQRSKSRRECASPNGFSGTARWSQSRDGGLPPQWRSIPFKSTTSSRTAVRSRRLFYALQQKSSLTHFVAPPSKNKTARPLQASSTTSALRCAGFCFCLRLVLRMAASILSIFTKKDSTHRVLSFLVLGG